MDLNFLIENWGVITGGLGMIVGGVIVVLRVFAPKTQTKLDDEALAKLEKIHKRRRRIENGGAK